MIIEKENSLTIRHIEAPTQMTNTTREGPPYGPYSSNFDTICCLELLTTS